MKQALNRPYWNSTSDLEKYVFLCVLDAISPESFDCIFNLLGKVFDLLEIVTRVDRLDETCCVGNITSYNVCYTKLY